MQEMGQFLYHPVGGTTLSNLAKSSQDVDSYLLDLLVQWLLAPAPLFTSTQLEELKNRPEAWGDSGRHHAPLRVSYRGSPIPLTPANRSVACGLPSSIPPPIPIWKRVGSEHVNHC